MSGVDRTSHHPTSRPPDHRVPDLCDHARFSAPGLLLLPRSLSLHAMPQLPPAHHEISKRDSPNKTKVKERQIKTVLDSNSNLAKLMTHHNQTKELTTWFLTMVIMRRGVIHPISQVMKSMKWSRMFMLSLVSKKGLARILAKMTCGRSNQFFRSYRIRKTLSSVIRLM
jgi:hypothetical protein